MRCQCMVEKMTLSIQPCCTKAVLWWFMSVWIHHGLEGQKMGGARIIGSRTEGVSEDESLHKLSAVVYGKKKGEKHKETIQEGT